MMICSEESVGAQQQEQRSRPAGAMGRGQQQAVLWSTVMSQIVALNPDRDNPIPSHIVDAANAPANSTILRTML
jgi:hypothetical protein